jgi:hypothetical protein
VHNFVVAIPFALVAVYIVISFRAVGHILERGEDWRSRLRSIVALGPGGLLKHGGRALLLIIVGLVILPLGISGYGSYLDYRAAPACDAAHAVDCRELRQLLVSGVHVQSAKSGQETVVEFGGGNGSATFYSDDVSPSALEVGGPVTAEVWRGTVTALVIDGRRHQSFGSQADAWIGIVVGAAMLVLGFSWLLVDLTVASMDPDIDRSHDRFTAPTKRRLTLYVLLTLFGVSLTTLAVAFIAHVLGNEAAANVLGAIYFIGAIVMLLVLVPVFVAWFVRVYLNVGGVGLRIRHSAWFVAAALLVPPLSLYMPYRLVQEVVAKTHAPVTPALLKNWWASALAFLALTILGVATSTTETTTPQALVQEAALGLSIVAGLAAAFFTIRLIHAVDATELALSHQH